MTQLLLTKRLPTEIVESDARGSERSVALGLRAIERRI